MSSEASTNYPGSKELVEQAFRESFEILARREASGKQGTPEHIAAKRRLLILRDHARICAEIIEGSFRKSKDEDLRPITEFNYDRVLKINRSTMSPDQIRRLSKAYAEESQPHLF